MLRNSQIIILVTVLPLIVSVILAVTAPTVDSMHPAVWLRVRVAVFANVGLTLLFTLIWYQFELRSSVIMAICFIIMYFFSLIALWTNFKLVSSEPTLIGLVSYFAISVYLHFASAAALMAISSVALSIYRKCTRSKNSYAKVSVKSTHKSADNPKLSANHKRDNDVPSSNRLKLAFGYTYAALLSLQGLYVALGQPEVVKVEVRYDSKVDGISKQFDGYRIVQLSDVHLGPSIGATRFNEVVQQVNSLNPDIVVITGDLVDAPHEFLRGAVHPVRNIRAPTYYITGNHEFYYHGVDAWLRELTDLGVRVLANDAVVLQSSSQASEADSKSKAEVCLCGMHDLQASKAEYPGQRSNFSVALRHCPADLPVILLVHQPRGAYYVLTKQPGDQNNAVPYGLEHTSVDERQRRMKLILTGHTHAGQVFPISIAVYLGHRLFVSPYFNGLYEHVDPVTSARNYVYVSAGTFYGCMPMRTGSIMEITEVTIRVS